MVSADDIYEFHSKHRGGRGDWVSPRGGKPGARKGEARNQRFLESERSKRIYYGFDTYEEVPGIIAQEIIDGKRR